MSQTITCGAGVRVGIDRIYTANTTIYAAWHKKDDPNDPPDSPGGGPGGGSGGRGPGGGSNPTFPNPPDPALDPSGYVYEAVASNRIEGARAEAYVLENGSAVLWDASEYNQETRFTPMNTACTNGSPRSATGS